MKQQDQKQSTTPYTVFIDVLDVKGPSWAPRLQTRRVVNLGVSDGLTASLTGGENRDGLLRASRLLPLRHPLELAGSVLVALVMVLLAPVVPWLGMLGTALLMLVVLFQLLLCWYIASCAPVLQQARREALADGTLAIVSANDISGMDLRRIDRALTTLQSRAGTRHDAEALAAVKAVLERDRAVSAEEPEPEQDDLMDSLFNSIVTSLTVKTPAQLIAEMEDRAARR